MEEGVNKEEEGPAARPKLAPKASVAWVRPYAAVGGVCLVLFLMVLVAAPAYLQILSQLLMIVWLPWTFGSLRQLEARIPSSRWYRYVAIPVLGTLAMAWLMMLTLAAVRDVPFPLVVREFRTGELLRILPSLIDASHSRSYDFGAGDVLLYLLNSATIAMAFPMHSRLPQMRKFFIELNAAALIVSIASIMLSVSCSRLIGLSPTISASMSLRSVTAPIAIASSRYLGGANESLVGGICVMTGTTGVLLYDKILGLLRRWTATMKKDTLDVMQGVAVGVSCHGQGTSMLLLTHPGAAPFSAIAFALLGIYSAVLMAIPAVPAAVAAIAKL